MRERRYKTLGTSIICRQISHPSLKTLLDIFCEHHRNEIWSVNHRFRGVFFRLKNTKTKPSQDGNKYTKKLRFRGVFLVIQIQTQTLQKIGNIYTKKNKKK